MGVIAVRLSDKDEVEIKKLAVAEGVSISEFCRNKILSQVSATKPDTDSVSVEVEATINAMHGDMQDMLKKLIELNRNLLRENRYYGELLGNYFTALFTSEETNLQESFSLAQQAAEESVKDL